jgi:hypothetical protein
MADSMRVMLTAFIWEVCAPLCAGSEGGVGGLGLLFCAAFAMLRQDLVPFSLFHVLVRDRFLRFDGLGTLKRLEWRMNITSSLHLCARVFRVPYW